jgi:hypothetical protein
VFSKILIKGKAVKVTLAFILIILTALVVFYIYVQVKTYRADAGFLMQAEANENLEISDEGRYLVITPAVYDPEQPSLIYYPGGLVDPHAYLYKMGSVAECNQVRVFIIKAPFNAAIFDINAAARIIDDYSLDNYWVGGHSLGGISAARFTAGNIEQPAGLFLLGSYSDQNLQLFDGKVVSIMGLEDRIINRVNYEKAKANLPSEAVIIELEGLNHSGFGNYGLQKNDGPGSLSEEEIINLLCYLLVLN